MTPEERLASLGIELPIAPKPVASYAPWRIAGGLVYVSGQLPMREGKVAFAGKVGRDVTLEDGAEAAKIAAINGLAQLVAAAGSLNQIKGIVRLGVFVSCTDDFTDQPKVANGASDLMEAVFGEPGKHARAAVGVNILPLNAAVEVEMIAQVG